MLSKQILISEYNWAKEKATEAFKNQNFNKGLALIRYAGRIAWDYPIRSNFVDDEIEDLVISNINRAIPVVEVKSISESIVFYCSWLGDNNALIEQYLYYFIENNIKTLLIVPNEKETLKGVEIKKRIKQAECVTLFYLSEKSYFDKIKAIRLVVERFAPRRVFLHLWPNDVIGFAAFSGIYGTQRFFVDHGDHVFWLGKRCSDYFIEFRSFGISIAVERRLIDRSKIIHIPFYPINNGIPFHGFPFNRDGKFIALSGANLYKYYLDSKLEYFRTIAQLLLDNSNMVFCLCGNGNPDGIVEIFKSYNVINQFYFLGPRTDFYSLVGQCDLLFESYPLKGGLTMLFAIAQDIPVIGISTNYNASGSIQDFLDLSDYIEPRSMDELYHFSSKLIHNFSERVKLSKKLAQNRFNKDHFSQMLDLIFSDSGNLISKNLNFDYELKLDNTRYLNEYLNLPSSTECDLNVSKLFILKSYLNLISRVKIFTKVLPYFIKCSFIQKIRILFLIIFGY